MFEFILSIWLSFVLVSASRKSRKCAATLPLFLGKDIPMLSFRFCLRWGGGVEEGLQSIQVLCGSSDSNVPTSEGVCQSSTVLISIGYVEMSSLSNFSDFIGLSSAWVGFSCASVAGAKEIMVLTLKGFIDGFKLLGLERMMGCCCPYLYGIVTSLESDSIVTICGSGDDTDEIVITSLASTPASSIELKITDMLFLSGLFFPDELLTQKTSESVKSRVIGLNIFNEVKNYLFSCYFRKVELKKWFNLAGNKDSLPWSGIFFPWLELELMKSGNWQWKLKLMVCKQNQGMEIWKWGTLE